MTSRAGKCAPKVKELLWDVSEGYGYIGNQEGSFQTALVSINSLKHDESVPFTFFLKI